MALKSPLKERNSSNDRIDELRLTLGEHLEELRGRLIRSALYIAVASAVGGLLAKPFFELVMAQVIDPLRSRHDIEMTMGVTEGFSYWIRLSVIIGLVLSAPLTVREIWGFIKPGLKPHERKPIETIVPISIALFLLGAFLGWMVLPPTINWFVGITSQFDGVKIFQNGPEIVSFCSKMILAFGLGFQLPLIVFFLARVGVVSTETIWRYWRQVTVAVFILSAVLTPSGDPFSMMVMAVPMTALFFASVSAAKISAKRSPLENDVLNNLD